MSSASPRAEHQMGRPTTADALIIVDVQAGFVSGPNAVPDHKNLLSMVEVLLTCARTSKAKVVFLQNDGAAGALDEPFKPGWSLYFSAQPSEVVMRKKKDDGFQGTGLDQLLRLAGVQTVAICGLSSEMCVAATARAAIEHGYNVLLPHDAHTTYDVPAGPGSQGVPAALAARVAEWSLGDEVTIYASAREVQFTGGFELS